MGTTALSDRLPHGNTSREIIGAFFDVYNGLGYGFLEVVYRRAMCVALRRRGLAVECEAPFAVHFGGEPIGEYRADIVVQRSVIVECKAVERVTATHEDQVRNYLNASGLAVGLVVNFGPRPSVRRVARSSPLK
jgi:GxxExxY protein